MQRAMDINSDVGESFGNYAFGADAEIMPHLSSANVACGFHAGDPVHMERTVTLARENDVAVGVHWGLPDVNGFGRREMKISTDEARCITLYQIGALRQVAASVGATIDHLVPHGALYPMLARDEAIAGAMVDAINSVGEPWVLYWPTPLERHRFYEIAAAEGIPIIHEFCADLGYRADGSVIVERMKKPVDPQSSRRPGPALRRGRQAAHRRRHRPRVRGAGGPHARRRPQRDRSGGRDPHHPRAHAGRRQTRQHAGALARASRRDSGRPAPPPVRMASTRAEPCPREAGHVRFVPVMSWTRNAGQASQPTLPGHLHPSQSQLGT